MLDRLGPEFRREGEIACHASAVIEPGAAIKGPAIIGQGCFVAASALLRGGVWLDEGCVIGAGVELKSVFMFSGSRAAHFNFIGDSVVGSDVNFEAGSVVANHRNERQDKRIRVTFDGNAIETGTEKFGALIGDGSRIGANAVLAPGTLLKPRTVVPRLGLIDQDAAGGRA